MSAPLLYFWLRDIFAALQITSESPGPNCLATRNATVYCRSRRRY